MFQAEKVTFVRYGFHVDDLLQGLDNCKRYDVEKSAKSYAELCHQALSQRYPNAEIKVSFDVNASGVLSNPMETCAELDDRPDLHEAESVNQLCDQIFQEYRWVVSRPWLTVTEAYKNFQVSTPVIRWTCKEGVIEDADRVEGRWEFPLDSFSRVVRNIASFKNMTDPPSTDVLIYECQLEDTDDIRTTEFPIGIKVLVVTDKDLGAPSLEGANSSVLVLRHSNKITLEFEHFIDASPWIGTRWSYDTYSKKVVSNAIRYNVDSGWHESAYAGKTTVESMWFKFVYDLPRAGTLRELIQQSADILENIIQETEIDLAGGPTWKEVYEKNERLFCKEVLDPLLRRMGFLNVRYTHGDDEYGRDFIFAERTRFGWLQYYGLQAKAGDISGEANSEIDKILAQIKDTFEMPYRELGSDERIYISVCIVAISGHFTRNAKEKIVEKAPRKGTAGSIYFLDKERILSLIAQCWT